MSMVLVCNINGKSQRHYEDKFQEHFLYNQNVLGDRGVCIYTRGVPQSQPPEIEQREQKEGFSYLSKYYVLKECIEKYHPEYVVWLDATVKIQPPFFDRVKAIMDTNGHMLLCNGDSGGEFWASDRFFRCINESRELFKLPLIVGTIFGIKISDNRGAVLLQQLSHCAKDPNMWFGPHGEPWEDPLEESSIGKPELSLDTRVRGHRHDQCILGYIAKKNNLILHNNIVDPIFYNQSYIRQEYLKDPTKSAYYFPYDAPATHHPTEAHLNGSLKK